METFSIEPIARIHNDYKDKFGIPRQSNLIESTLSKIIFEEKYRDDNALRGLDGYSHIWLLWIFSETDSSKDWSPTVRPPRLGGNKRIGVFSTRSPYHPNRIGLSCVKISSIEKTKENGTVINVLGADLLDNTPIIDIKPYLSFTDSHPDAVCGFAEKKLDYRLEVEFNCNVNNILSDSLKTELCEIFSQDPRPSYHNNPKRVYGLKYAEYEIKFSVDNYVLTVLSVQKLSVGGEK